MLFLHQNLTKLFVFVMVDKVGVEAKKDKDVIDASQLVSNNQNNLGLEYVGFWKRLVARIIDGIVFFLFTSIVGSFLLTPFILSINKVSENRFLDFQQVLNRRVSELNIDSKINIFETIKYTSNPDCNLVFAGYDKDKSNCNELKNTYVAILLTSTLFSTLIGVVYFVGLTFSKWKSTFGKKIMKLEVVNSVNSKISLLQSFARESFWIIYGIVGLISPFTSFGYTVGLLVFLFILIESFKTFFNEKHRSLHDDIADTYVITRSDNF